MDDLKKIFSSFENLGDNCEFGIAQRVAGIEPLGLFRFAGTTHLPSLISAFESQFESFGDPDDIELFGESGGYYSVHIRSFHVIYATPTRWKTQKEDVVIEREVARIKFLKRKLTADLTDARKVFVRKDGRSHFREIRALSSALRRFGPNTLLWVTEADDDHPNGGVEILAEGIFRGRINKFAPTENVPSLIFDDWAAVCTQIYKLLNCGEVTGVERRWCKEAAG